MTEVVEAAKNHPAGLSVFVSEESGAKGAVWSTLLVFLFLSFLLSGSLRTHGKRIRK